MEEPREPLLSPPNPTPPDSAFDFLMEQLGDSIQTDAANALQAHEKREQRLMYARMSGRDRRLNIYKSIATRDSSLALPVIFNPGERQIPAGRLQDILSDDSRKALPAMVDIPQAIEILGGELAALENGDIYRDLDVRQITEDTAETLQKAEYKITAIKGGLLLLAERSLTDTSNPNLAVAVSAFRAANIHTAHELVPTWIVDSIAENIEPLDINDEAVRVQLVQLLETPLFQATEDERALLLKGNEDLTSRLKIIKKARAAQILAQEIAETKKRDELKNTRRQAYLNGEQSYVASAMSRGTEAVNTSYRRGESLNLRNFPIMVIVDNLPAGSKSELLREAQQKQVKLNTARGLLFTFEFVQSDPELLQEVIDAASKQWSVDFGGVTREEYMGEGRATEWTDHARKAVLLDMFATAESMLERACIYEELSSDERGELQRATLKVLGGEHASAFLLPDPDHPLTAEQQLVRKRLIEFQLIFDDAKFAQVRKAIETRGDVAPEVRAMFDRVTEARGTLGELNQGHKEFVLKNFADLAVVAKSSNEEFASDSAARTTRKAEVREERLRREREREDAAERDRLARLQAEEAALQKYNIDVTGLQTQTDELIRELEGIRVGDLEQARIRFGTLREWQQQVPNVRFDEYLQISGKGSEAPRIEVKQSARQQFNQTEEKRKQRLDALRANQRPNQEEIRLAELAYIEAQRNARFLNELERRLEEINRSVRAEPISKAFNRTKMEGRFWKWEFNRGVGGEVQDADIQQLQRTYDDFFAESGRIANFRQDVEKQVKRLLSSEIINDPNARGRQLANLADTVSRNRSLLEEVGRLIKRYKPEKYWEFPVEKFIKETIQTEVVDQGLMHAGF